jgi:hypothetical protein
VGILDSLAGRQQHIDHDQLRTEFAPILVDGETIELAFKVMRDLIVFTDRRLITVDRQGVTGKKVDYRSIPYSKITMFSKESAGIMDFDAELKLWVGSNPTPLQFAFTKDAPINDVYRVLSRHLLG